MREIDKILLGMIEDKMKDMSKFINHNDITLQMEQITHSVVKGKVDAYLLSIVEKESRKHLASMIDEAIKTVLQKDDIAIVLEWLVRKYICSQDFENEIQSAIWAGDRLEDLFGEILKVLKSMKKDESK